VATIRSAGYVVATRSLVLAYYRTESRARRRCEAERSSGVDAKVYEVMFSMALGEAA
jgi:hypothetical protein